MELRRGKIYDSNSKWARRAASAPAAESDQGGVLDKRLLEAFGNSVPHSPPAAGPASTAPSPVLDLWLAAHATGEDQPPWAAQAAPLLEKMLTAPTPRERLAGSLALASLGRPEKAATVALAAAATAPELVATAGQTLPWLELLARRAQFQQLRRLAGR